MSVRYSDLKNKKIFISGGGSGIGATIVEYFCEQNSDVYFIDINLKESKKLLAKIKKRKLKAPKFIECDITDINKLQKTIEDICKFNNLDATQTVKVILYLGEFRSYITYILHKCSRIYSIFGE